MSEPERPDHSSPEGGSAGQGARATPAEEGELFLQHGPVLSTDGRVEGRPVETRLALPLRPEQGRVIDALVVESLADLPQTSAQPNSYGVGTRHTRGRRIAPNAGAPGALSNFFYNLRNGAVRALFLLAVLFAGVYVYRHSPVQAWVEAQARSVELLAWSWWREVPSLTTTPVLSIESEPPGATIFIDGAFVGETPLYQENTFPAREVSIRLTLKGRKPWTGTFQGARTAKVQAVLKK